VNALVLEWKPKGTPKLSCWHAFDGGASCRGRRPLQLIFA
jgi:hypothetical protein